MHGSPLCQQGPAWGVMGFPFPGAGWSGSVLEIKRDWEKELAMVLVHTSSHPASKTGDSQGHGLPATPTPPPARAELQAP